MRARADGVLTALGPTYDGSVVTALESSGQVRITRRCADLPDLLATAASGVGSVALVAADLRGLSLSDVARLGELGLAVVGVSDPGAEGTELRLRQLGLRWVVAADAHAELVAAVLEAATGAPPGPGPAGTWPWPTSASAPPVSSQVAPEPSRPWPTPGGGPSPFVPVAPQPAPGFPGVDAAASAGAAWAERTERGRVIAVWGPAGAPGRTTVAVNLAAELALLGRQVLLVDADTYGGAVAQTLSVLDEAPGLVAACRAADLGTLDLAVLARLTPQVWSGLRVLTGIPKAERWPEVRAAALERVLDVARSLADVVVVDTGFCLEDDEELSYDTLAPRRNQATLSTLASADELIVVGGCDPVSLQRLVRAVQELGAVPAPPPLVVVNRARPAAVGGPPDRQVGDALARFAGVSEVVYLPEDPVGLDAALFAGRALAEAAPGAPARKAIAHLAGRLAGLPDSAARAPRASRGRRSRAR